ncbi:MAG: hypothetical protein ABI577_00765 [bacterium]
MADAHDSHAPADPNAAPLRQDIRQSFSPGAVLFCYALAAIALVSGIVAGLTLIND